LEEKEMAISSRLVRILSVLGLAVLGLILAGCIVLPGFNFIWKAPALQLSHTSFSEALDDFSADIVRYSDKSYIVYYGTDIAANGGDREIYLRVTDQFAGHVISSTQLTDNATDDTQPHITTSRGYLYVVYRHYGGNFFFVPNYNIYWLKIRVSDLAIVAGPTLVSTSTDDNVQDDINPQIVHTSEAGGANSRTDIVWESPAITGSTVYTHAILWNYVTDGGIVGNPITVSVGSGCPGSKYNQYVPRITHSANGTASYVAWFGHNSLNATYKDVYWRSIDNSTATYNTGCSNVSLGDGDDSFDARMSTGIDNVSYVAYDRLFGATDNDVILRPVESNGTVCERVTYTAGSGADDYNPDVAAGDTVSNWVHLVWQHPVGGYNEVWYDLYDASNCGSAPTPINNVAGDANGIITLTVSPYPISTTAGVPLIAVATNADVLPANAQRSLNPADLQARLDQLVDRGILSKSEADSLLADGQVTSGEVEKLMEAHLALAQARAQVVDPLKPGDSAAPALVNRDGRHPLDADAQAFALRCAVTPDDEDCQMAGLRLSTAPSAPSTPNSPTANCNGIAAEDAIVVAWNGGSDAWADEGAASSYKGSSCYTGVLADNGPVKLHRTDEAQVDSSPTRVLITNKGVAHVVWPGYALHNGFFDLPNDYDIFYAVTHIPVYLPLVLKN
jgi:hypothetical protein